MKRFVYLLTFVLLGVGIPAGPGAAAEEPTTGSVVGFVSGEPAALKGARVSLSASVEDWEPAVPVASDGSYRIDNVAPGAYTLLVGGDGLAWSRDYWQEQPLTYYAGYSVNVVAGRVATPPVQRVLLPEDMGRISIVEPGTDQRTFSVWTAEDPDRAVISQDVVARDGEVSDLALAPGRYKIQRGSNGWFGGRSFDSAKIYTVRPGETLAVTPPARDDRIIRGVVGFADVQIVAYAADDPTEVLDRTMTTPAGHFQLHGFSRNNRYKLRAIDPSGRLQSTWLGGNTFHSATAIKPDLGFNDDPRSLQMKRRDGVPRYTPPLGTREPGQISGSVSGSGVNWNRNGMLLIDAVHEEVERYDISFKRDRTYTFEGIRPGDYKMKVNAGQWVGGRSFDSAKVFRVESGVTTMEDIEIGPSGHLEAQVLNQNGRPIPGLMVEAHTGTGADEIVARVTPGFFGDYTFSRLPVRPYKFRVVDVSGRYEDAWIGGGASIATAPSFVPDPDAVGVTFLPDTHMRPVLRPVLAPAVGGTARYGYTLTAVSSGTWSMPGLTVRRQWLRDGSPITGQQGSQYTLRSADVGRNVSFRTTASKTGQPTRVAESRVQSIRPSSARMRLTPGMGRHSSKLRVNITAPGVSAARIQGTIRVRDRSGAGQVVKATMRRGSVTVSLRRIKNGSRTLDVTFEGPAWLTVPTGRVALKVR